LAAAGIIVGFCLGCAMQNARARLEKKIMFTKLNPALAGLIVLFGYAGAASASSVVTVSPSVPHPKQNVTVSGMGFAASEAIDVYLDTTDTLLIVSTATGTFSASLSLPATEQPGKHYATAIGRKSGDSAQIAFTVSTPWAEYGFGYAHNGFNQYENTVNTSNVGSLGLLWSAATSPVLSGAAVQSGYLYTAGRAGIKAVKTSTGTVIWTADQADSFYSSPAVAGSVVYIGSDSTSNLYAVSASSGAKTWTYALGGTTRSSPVVVNGVVYIGCNDNKVYAINASTGGLGWTYTTGGAVASSPAVVDGVLYVGSLDGKLYALDATTGALLWSFTTGDPIYASPVVANGVVYIGSYDDNFYAVQGGANGGAQIWSYTTGGSIYGAAAFFNNKVVVGSDDDSLYEFNARTGALNWIVNTGEVIDGTPSIANGVIYVGTDGGTLLMIDALSGYVDNSIVSPPYVVAQPVISDGVLYFNGEYSKTYAYALGSGIDQLKRAAPRISSLRPDMRLAVTR
jgi:outer membrane protein assembly factor BamB